MSLDFLLEIGTEEIPHWMIPGALTQLAEAGSARARRRACDATPRRLVVQASGLPERTPDQRARSSKVRRSPPATRPRPASRRSRASIARRHAGQAASTTSCARRIPGRADARHSRRNRCPAAILGIHWPKTMYWTGGKNGPRFIRPIRWIVALLGDQVIPFEIAGVQDRQRHARASHAGLVVHSRHHRELRSELREELRDPLRRMSGATRSKRKPPRWARSSIADLLETLTFITEYPDRHPRRLRSGVSRTARRSADHGDAASPEIFLGRTASTASWRRTSSRS